MLTDRFSIIIESQPQLEGLIQEWGFLPFFRNDIPGFSIEELTPPRLLFGDDMMQGPWQWKGLIIGNWQSAYGKFYRGKAGYISLEWLPDFINWRRSLLPLQHYDADSRHILSVLTSHESLLSKELKVASGFTLSRKATDQPAAARRNGPAFDARICQLQMGTHVCIADFEYLVSKRGETYGWGVARYCTTEAMYPDLFPLQVEGRSPEQSYHRIIQHLRIILPDATERQLHRLLRP